MPKYLQDGGLIVKSAPKKWMVNYLDSEMYKKRLLKSKGTDVTSEERQDLLNTNFLSRPEEPAVSFSKYESDFIRHSPKDIVSTQIPSKYFKAGVPNINMSNTFDTEIRDSYKHPTNIDNTLANAPILKDDLIAHELSHVQRNLNESEASIISKLNKKNTNTNVHDSNANEQKADLDAFRYQMFKHGVYDTSTKDMDMNDFNKAKSVKSIADSFIFKRLMKSFTPRDLIKFNNTIAKTNTDLVPIARSGGILEHSDTNTMKIEVKGKEYHVQVACTEEEKECGLQNVPEIAEDGGMLFIYEEPQEHVSFWMKDTLINLDIVFIDEDWEILKVATGYADSEKAIPCDNVMYVLEVKQGSGIKVGDDVDLGDIDEYESEETEESDDKSSMQVLDSKGESQMDLKGGERIFSRKHTKILLRFAKKAYKSKSTKDYKALGKRMFQYLHYQDNKEDDFVEIKD